MKVYSLLIFILLLIFSQSVLSHQTKAKLRKLDTDTKTSYEIYNYRIVSNSIIHGMYISNAKVLVDLDNMILQLQSWIMGNNDTEVVANQLSTDRCDMIYKTIMEGIRTNIYSRTAETDSVNSTSNYHSNFKEPNTNSNINVIWDPINVKLDGTYINISCQGSIQGYP